VSKYAGVFVIGVRSDRACYRHVVTGVGAVRGRFANRPYQLLPFQNYRDGSVVDE
jgi:hypothetical protein